MKSLPKRRGAAPPDPDFEKVRSLFMSPLFPLLKFLSFQRMLQSTSAVLGIRQQSPPPPLQPRRYEHLLHGSISHLTSRSPNQHPSREVLRASTRRQPTLSADPPPHLKHPLPHSQVPLHSRLAHHLRRPRTVHQLYPLQHHTLRRASRPS